MNEIKKLQKMFSLSQEVSDLIRDRGVELGISGSEYVSRLVLGEKRSEPASEMAHIIKRLDELYEKLCVDKAVPGASKLEVARAALSRAEGGFNIEPVEEVSPEEKLRLQRVVCFKKHGQCVELDKFGNERYFDSEGMEIES